MRRTKQQLPQNEAEDLLSRGTSGVLSLVDETGAPYGVPLSYLWAEGKVIFHGAPVGLKMDCIAGEARASFCVIGADEVVPERYTTHYRSVIVRGRISVVTDPAEKVRLAVLLGERYRPGFPEAAAREIPTDPGRLCIFTLTPEEITGKESRELMEMRGKRP